MINSETHKKRWMLRSDDPERVGNRLFLSIIFLSADPPGRIPAFFIYLLFSPHKTHTVRLFEAKSKGNSSIVNKSDSSIPVSEISRQNLSSCDRACVMEPLDPRICLFSFFLLFSLAVPSPFVRVGLAVIPGSHTGTSF